MRAPFWINPYWSVWTDPEDLPLAQSPDLTVWVDDDPEDVLVDVDGAPLRRPMPFGFCRQEAREEGDQ